VSDFSCSGLPLGASCTFTPVSVTPGSSNATVQLSITSTARYMAQAGVSRRSWGVAWLMSAAFLLGGLVLVRVPRRSRGGVLLSVLLVGILVFSWGCGGGGGSAPSSPQPNPNATPAGTYSITVKAVGNSATTRTATVSLTVK
jgi:hypothetical protein